MTREQLLQQKINKLQEFIGLFVNVMVAIKPLINKDVDNKLNTLCAGQTKLYAYITMGAFICAPLISYGLSKI